MARQVKYNFNGPDAKGLKRMRRMGVQPRKKVVEIHEVDLKELTHKERSYSTKEYLTPSQLRMKKLTAPQKALIKRASHTQWRSRKDLECTEAAARALVRAGLMLSELRDVEMVYKLKEDLTI